MGKISAPVLALKSPMPWGFIAAAAVGAAALVDPIVEGLSNAGFFGAGRLTDGSNADVLPALCIAGVLFCVAAASMAIRIFSHESYPPPWLRRCARKLHSTPLTRLIPAIFVLQMLSLFTMETVEQIVTAGHPLGGFIWLGGPILISIALHLGGCIVTTIVLSQAIAVSARTVARILHFVIGVFRQISASAPLSRLDLNYAITLRDEPYRRSSRGRAPPTPLSVNPLY